MQMLEVNILGKILPYNSDNYDDCEHNKEFYLEDRNEWVSF